MSDFEDILVRSHVWLQGFGIRAGEDIGFMIDDALAALSAQASQARIATMKRNQLSAFLRQADKRIREIPVMHETVRRARQLAVYESEFMGQALGDLAAAEGIKFQAALPTATQLKSAILSDPLRIAGPDGGKLVRPFLIDHTQKMVMAVESEIKLGIINGNTTPEIAAAIAGKDKALRAAMMAVTRTAMNHASNVARREFARQNKSIIGRERWVSTLDGRTSAQCRSLDGRTFELGKGPRPPAHINCRSTMIPVLKGRLAELDKGGTRRDNTTGTEVPAGQSYYAWLKKQPVAFQDSVLGTTKGAIFRQPNMTISKFRMLELDRRFMPRSITEIKRLYPAALPPRLRPKAPTPPPTPKAATGGFRAMSGRTERELEFHDNAKWREGSLGAASGIRTGALDVVSSNTQNQAFFRNWTNEIEMGQYKPDSIAGAAVWRHEFGHKIDNYIGNVRNGRENGRGGWYATGTEAYDDAIKADKKRWATTGAAKFKAWKATSYDMQDYAAADKATRKTMLADAIKKSKSTLERADLDAWIEEHGWVGLLRRHAGQEFQDLITDEAKDFIAFRFYTAVKNRDLSNALRTMFADPNTAILWHDVLGVNLQRASSAGSRITAGYLKEHGNGAMLSDIADAISHGNVNHMFGHSKSYYQKGNSRARQKEVFANFVSIEGDTAAGAEGLNIIRALFPNSAREAELILNDFTRD